jgi:hypothetical protein
MPEHSQDPPQDGTNNNANQQKAEASAQPSSSNPPIDPRMAAEPRVLKYSEDETPHRFVRRRK